ncbi:hypothetical protein HYC85_018186 [Camellia sinensis]|uniref:PGG domain-containing protein n=1 Tax=Camellia sinensis TaxID=4442 RepID=A0A7J7GTK8_CAMSI|nr:hypothetical protein HYC85_018186 [Camellia sinensis]
MDTMATDEPVVQLCMVLSDIQMGAGRGIHFTKTEDRDTHDRYEYEASDFGRSNSMASCNIQGSYSWRHPWPENSTTTRLPTQSSQPTHPARRQDSSYRRKTSHHHLGHHHLVEPIQSSCPDLFKSKNCNDDHPLHLAAAGGHLSIVQSLISNALRFAISSGRETEAEQDILDVTKGQNKQGNTPLHMAVKNHQYEVALFLFTGAGSLLTSCVPNLEKKSPLYMAAEAGHQELFELMMQFVASNVDAQNMLKDSQPLLHVAITTRNKGNSIFYHYLFFYQQC